QSIHQQNLYRLAGVTAFKVRDPSANGKGDLLGIRIECFALKKFAAPHYILLSVNGKTDSYELYKHTVPLYIPLASLANKYLNKDLRVFVRAVRKEIIMDVNKRTHLSCLPNVVAIEADDACELVKLEFDFPKHGACIAYLRCDMVDIKSAVVTKFLQQHTDDPEMDHEFEDEEPETIRDETLEALMPGRIDQLHVRLAKIE
ncbi:Cenp-O kinetochore centromere component-domain-containing protein, partial [Lipomyces kononenkoae]